MPVPVVIPSIDPISIGINIVTTAIPFIISAINRGKPNPNDWQGWVALDRKNNLPIGTNAVTWIIKDGDSIQNEALNILQYIKNYGTQDILKYNSYYNRTITVNDILNKLNRGGYQNEANQLIQQPTNNLFQPSGSNNNTTNQAGISPIVLLAIAGGAIFLFTRKKKK